MVDNIDPRAQATSASPDTARTNVQDAAIDIFGVLNAITTKQGEVFAITLDVGDTSGELDSDFRGDALSVQDVLTNSAFGITQKIYLQTDASRLAELGTLSGKVFQAKYAELNTFLVGELSGGRITAQDFIDAQEAMLTGVSSRGTTLASIITKYDKVENGEHTLSGFRDLVGIFNEVGYVPMTTDTGAAVSEKDLLRDLVTGAILTNAKGEALDARTNPPTAIPLFTPDDIRVYSIDAEGKLVRSSRTVSSMLSSDTGSLASRQSAYLSIFNGNNSLIAKLADKTITKFEFIEQQRKAIDTMLDSNPVESSASYLQEYKSLIDQLLDLGNDAAFRDSSNLRVSG